MGLVLGNGLMVSKEFMDIDSQILLNLEHSNHLFYFSIRNYIFYFTYLFFKTSYIRLSILHYIILKY